MRWYLSQRRDDQPIYVTDKPCGAGRVAKIWMGRSKSIESAMMIVAAPDMLKALSPIVDEARAQLACGYDDDYSVPVTLTIAQLRSIVGAVDMARGRK